MEPTALLGVFVCLVGLFINSCNLAVFLKQKWKNNTVTMTLLALTMSDFGVLTFTLLFVICGVVADMDPTVDLHAIRSYFLAWTRSMFYDISSLTTVLASLERCLCVVMPLKVHVIFSIRRTKMALIGVWLVGVLTYCPIYATLRLTWRSENNVTRLTVAVSEGTLDAEYANNVINTLFLLSACQVLVAVNTVVMTIVLRRSVRFQKNATLNPDTPEALRNTHAKEILNTGSNHNQNDNDKTLQTNSPNTIKNSYRIPSSVYKSNTGSRELQDDKIQKKKQFGKKYSKTIRVVGAVSCLFIFLNLPILAVVYAKRIVPGYDVGGRYHDLFMLTVDLLFIVCALNASANFFVYITMNNRYREDFLSIFARKAPHKIIAGRIA